MKPIAATLTSVILLCVSLFAQPSNPVPLINQPVVPASVAPGGPGFTLTVNGTGFVVGSVVNWNGSARSTTYVNQSKVTALIDASDISNAATASVTVVSPGPGGGTSNAVFLPITLPTGAPVFNGSSIPLSGSPSLLISADLNGDGKLDLISTFFANGSQGLSVMLGKGDGTFQPRTDYPISNQLTGLAAADVNGDGKPDLIVSLFVNGSGTGAADVLLNNGNGTFQQPVQYSTSTGVQEPVVADLNKDGNLDLILCDRVGIYVLFGNGNGSFQSPVYSVISSTNLLSMVAADFNRDGNLDLAFAATDDNTIVVVLGNGDGSFQPPSTYSPGNGVPIALTVADFNGDGNLDLAVMSDNGPQRAIVSILLGNGDGGFQQNANYGSPTLPRAIATADLNGDGSLDLVVTNDSSDFASVSILLGNGDGTFQATLDRAGRMAESATIADFNADGRLDLAVSNSRVSALTVLTAGETVVQLSPGQLSFKTQLVGTISNPKDVTLHNTGTATLSISKIVTTPNFARTGNCGGSLPAGQSCTISAYFAPTTRGDLSGSLVVYDNGGGSPQTVSLSGSATVVLLSPANLNFGDQMVGTSSPPRKVILTNTGSKNLKFSGFGIGGANAHDFTQINACGGFIKAGQRCEIDVIFTPTAQGPRTAVLGVADDGGASPQKVSLSGTGD